jgi:hypothetical protein
MIKEKAISLSLDSLPAYAAVQQIPKKYQSLMCNEIIYQYIKIIEKNGI